MWACCCCATAKTSNASQVSQAHDLDDAIWLHAALCMANYILLGRCLHKRQACTAGASQDVHFKPFALFVRVHVRCCGMCVYSYFASVLRSTVDRYPHQRLQGI